MNTTLIYPLIGLIHVVSFILILAIVKLWLKKSISAKKIMKSYIVVFFIALSSISAYSIMMSTSASAELMQQYPLFAIGTTIGEFIVFGIFFYILDSSSIWIGKKVFY